MLIKRLMSDIKDRWIVLINHHFTKISISSITSQYPDPQTQTSIRSD